MTDAATPVWLTGEYATLKFERVNEHDVRITHSRETRLAAHTRRAREDWVVERQGQGPMLRDALIRMFPPESDPPSQTDLDSIHEALCEALGTEHDVGLYLDDVVLDAKSREGSAINNEGAPAQLRYLLSTGLFSAHDIIPSTDWETNG